MARVADRNAPDDLLLVQDLANTLDVEDDSDALDAPGALAAFAETHGMAGLGLTAADLPAMKDLREALRAVCLAHTGAHTGAEAPADAEERLNGLLADAPLVLRVEADGTARLLPAPGLAGVRALTARVAAGVATAAADGRWRRLKACEAHDCLWVFYDRSPAGRGRWCTMAVCGSRAKMRAYRAKKRA